MHELPKDLTNSLRSFRGSVYGDRRKADVQQEMDLEKGSDDYRDKDFERALSPTESSVSTDSHKQFAHSQHQDVGRDNINARPASLRPETRDINPTSPSTPKPASKKAVIESRSEVYGGQAVKDLDPASERLARNLTPLSDEDFCSLMGMRQWKTDLEGLDELAVKNGLYYKIDHDMRRNSRRFHAFDIATYILLIVQLIISAIFIILGALRHLDTHIPIAVLGAVATLIAGTVALMKGQGLPNRLRQTRDSLRNVLFEAEELYWDIRSGRPVLFKDIKKIREDYLRVLQQARAHHPDAWSEEADNIAVGSRGFRGERAEK